MSSRVDLTNAAWHKSSYSKGERNCVEVSGTFAADGIVPVRDSKDTDRPAVIVPLGTWDTFVATVKADGFTDV